jgi:hypothetical protein
VGVTNRLGEEDNMHEDQEQEERLRKHQAGVGRAALSHPLPA